MYKQLYTLYISFTQYAPRKPAGSSISEAMLLWVYCKLGHSQCVDTSDLELRGNAEPAKLDFKVHTDNLDTTQKDQAAFVLHLL